jgi:hypothetical protein
MFNFIISPIMKLGAEGDWFKVETLSYEDIAAANLNK